MSTEDKRSVLMRYGLERTMQENYSIFSYEFLNRGWDKKELSLIAEIGYRHRVKSQLGIKKKAISFNAGINPASFSRSIRSIEFKTNQHFNYDNAAKQITQAITTYYKNQKQIHIQVDTKYIRSRLLKVSDITLYGYLKGLGGSWNKSAYKLTQTLNKWLTKHKWDNLTLSYTSILTSLKKLVGLKLIKTQKQKYQKLENQKDNYSYQYTHMEIIANSVEASWLEIKKLMEWLNEKYDSSNWLLTTI